MFHSKEKLHEELCHQQREAAAEVLGLLGEHERVFPVKRQVLTHEDPQLCAATSYEKQVGERCNRRVLHAFFLWII